MRTEIRALVAAVVGSLVVAAVALAASSPSVVTGGATKVADNSAVLNGTVNPNGSSTTYYFQWGLTNSYGVTGKSHGAGSGTKARAVSETAAGLIPGTTYHYRLVASNRYGTAAGRDRTFTTAGHPPPNATTGPTTALASRTVTLTGVITPNGQETAWTFQYGLNTEYGMETFGSSVSGTSSTVEVASELQGLAPGTIFHYRLVASHSNAPTSYGADETFMTYPSPRPLPRLRAATRPRRDRRRPFVVTTSGRVSGPGWIPAAYACNGNVEIQFFNGSRRVASTLAALQSNCAFSGTTSFRHRPGRGRNGSPVSLQIRIRFLGNHYLAPKRAHPETVTLG